jgi:hypothetical protein
MTGFIVFVIALQLSMAFAKLRYLASGNAQYAWAIACEIVVCLAVAVWGLLVVEA